MHICRTVLQFPSKEELQLALENHKSISGSWVQEKKITDIFANALADRKRSPIGLRVNIELLLSNHFSEIPLQHQRDILALFTRVLTEIAEYTHRQNPSNRQSPSI